MTLNNRDAQLGDKAVLNDKVRIDGKLIDLKRYSDIETRVLILNKQAGFICSNKDTEGRKSVFDLLPKNSRWIMIGRLDLNTSGLLLFTNNGELANKLAHPSSQIEREYAVRVMGQVTPNMVRRMHEGVVIDNHLCRFTDIQYYAGEGINKWFHVVIMEGRNRGVRKLWESQGLRVSRLKRVRFGPILIPSSVRRGLFLELSTREVQKLQRLVGL